MAVTARLRFEILRRDGFACRYCGRRAPDVELHVDHVQPEALGGKTEPANLAAACADCNSGKASVPPDAAVVADVRQDAARWTAALAEAAETQARDESYARYVCSNVVQEWEGHTLPSDWRQSVAAMLAAGANDEMLYEATMVALEARGVRDRWRYFCGVVGRKLDDRAEMARELVERAA